MGIADTPLLQGAKRLKEFHKKLVSNVQGYSATGIPIPDIS